MKNETDIYLSSIENVRSIEFSNERFTSNILYIFTNPVHFV